LQQKLALVLSFSSFWTGAGLRLKKCRAGAGLDGLRDGCGLGGPAGRVRVGRACGAGAGKISQTPAARGGLKF